MVSLTSPGLTAGALLFKMNIKLDNKTIDLAVDSIKENIQLVALGSKIADFTKVKEPKEVLDYKIDYVTALFNAIDKLEQYKNLNNESN